MGDLLCSVIEKTILAIIVDPAAQTCDPLQMTPQFFFELKPFSPLISSFQFSVSFEISAEELQFKFKLMGLPADIARLVWPRATVGAASRRDGLWQTTVFELFIGEPGKSAYLEFNFSPSGDWNAYRFSSEREGMQEIASLRENVVKKMRKTTDTIVVEGTLNLQKLSLNRPIELSATSILDFDSHKEYWAIAHKGEKPDFHLRKSFIARIE